ncbi:UPF0158 family protein [Sporosarcina sp. PTS2304]|uniref:UPF0158 family protein n=1 Tax=Sporosarcina sp. PTS2304 TaxID=2283194 RepID=UPI0013B47344|nr:UPF0158 family protein [Sporosarcina sp. PTS2304]
MKLLDELIDIYLEGSDPEMEYVLNCRNEEILLDGPESLTGEPEIDWDTDEADDLIVIPTSSSSEMYQVMMEFAQKQSDDAVNRLQASLNGRKPFPQFKDAVSELGVDKEWYEFERDYAREKMVEWLSEKGRL